MNKEHVVILVVGKTGSGKSSLINKLCERMGYTQLISYTTRPRRSDADNDHVFVTTEDYLKAKTQGEIVAETEIAGNYYYATREQLYTADLYTIDPKGREALLSMDLPDIRFVTVYISCPDNIREDRAVHQRKDDIRVYHTRAFSERSQFRQFVSEESWDYSIKNVNFAKAYATLHWISQVEGIWKNHQDDTK